MKLKLIVVVTLLAVAGLVLIPFGRTHAFTSSTVEVTPTNMNGWSYLSENTAGASGSIVSGPTTPPLGSGSAEFNVPLGTNAFTLGTLAYHNTRLADITTLKYHTYGNFSTQAVALQFDVDNNGIDGDLGYQGRVVFEPYQIPGSVVANTWQEWDVLAGRWWGSSGGGTRPIRDACPQASPCTTAQLLTLFPDLRVFGRFLFKAGSGWPAGFVGNVDALTVGVSGNDVTYDFEPDSDGDGISDGSDNCPFTSNAGQEDNDNDGVGDVCDADDDNDTVPDVSDNCPLTANTSQLNTDGDAYGDACDPDDDNDGVLDGPDNCDVTFNPTQSDFDGDGIGDACDSPNGPPTNKNQCKNGGWMNWTPRFRNQGDCIQWFNNGH